MQYSNVSDSKTDRQTDRHRHRAMVYAELMYSIAWQIYYNIKTRGVVDR